MHRCKVKYPSQISSDNNKRVAELYQVTIPSSSMSNLRSCLEILYSREHHEYMGES